MKKRGSKKKINSHKSWKSLFFFNNKTTAIVLTFVFLFLLVLLPLFTTGSAINSSLTGMVGEGDEQSGDVNVFNIYQGGSNGLDGVVTWKWLNAVQWLNLPDPLTWKEFIVFIVTIAILFTMLFDMLSLISIFSGWASGVIAGGMTIVASLVGFVRVITTWFITIGATMGIAAGFIEIGVSIVIFVGLVFGSSVIARFAAKRKGQKEYIKAIGSSAQAGAAIKGLRHIQKEFRRKD
jgi:hypothetical protein